MADAKETSNLIRFYKKLEQKPKSDISELTPEQLFVRMRADEYFHFSQASIDLSSQVQRRLPIKNILMARLATDSVQKNKIKLSSAFDSGQVRSIEQLAANRANKIRYTNLRLANQIQKQHNQYVKHTSQPGIKFEHKLNSQLSMESLPSLKKNRSLSSIESIKDYSTKGEESMLRNQSKISIYISKSNARLSSKRLSEQKKENIKQLERLQNISSQYTYEPLEERAKKFDRYKALHKGGKMDIIVGSTFKPRHSSNQNENLKKSSNKQMNLQHSQSKLRFHKNPSQASINTYKRDPSIDAFKLVNKFMDDYHDDSKKAPNSMLTTQMNTKTYKGSSKLNTATSPKRNSM